MLTFTQGIPAGLIEQGNIAIVNKKGYKKLNSFLLR